MRIKKFAVHMPLTLFSLLISTSAVPYFTAFGQRGPASAPQLNISQEEQSLVKAIVSAPDVPAKLKAAGALINKFPKTLIRPRTAKGLADQIADVKDPSQRINFVQEYQKIFTEETEQNLIIPVLVGAYVDAGRIDEAFTTGSAFLTKQPDSLRVLVRLTLAGNEEAKKQKTKYLANSLQYGAKAIEIIEADKQPADLNAATWTYYKSLLPNLYQSLGLLNLVKGNDVEAKAKLIKAAELKPTDPFNYLMLADILNDEYRTEAKRVLQLPEGQPKQDALQKALTMLDSVIDAYAHMIALSEGNPQFQQTRQQYLQDLETYYKFRHHSTEGMQQLIDKYKIAAK